MNECTLYVIPTDDPSNHNIARIERYLEESNIKVVELNHRDLNSVEKETDWYGFVFGNEWIDHNLVKALPIYFKNEYDYLVMFKKVNIQGSARIFQAPRFFRKEVKLGEKHNLVPADPDNLKMVRALDGWILEDPRG